MSATVRPGPPTRPASTAPRVATAAAHPAPRPAPVRLPGLEALRAWTPRQRRALARSLIGVSLALVAVALLAALGWGVRTLWENRLPLLTPRHRPEALCFRLAESPVFAPPMHVEPSVAVVRGRFASDTPAAFAIRSAMRLDDGLIFRERRLPVGDYDVSTMWVRVPGSEGAWLLVGWMEGADLALCSFQFASEDGIPPTTVAWGDRLLARVLVPDNFRAGVMPSARWRAPSGATLPSFGPPLASPTTR